MIEWSGRPDYPAFAWTFCESFTYYCYHLEDFDFDFIYYFYVLLDIILNNA